MSRVNSSQLINSRVRIANDLGIPSYKGWKQATVLAPKVEWQTLLVFSRNRSENTNSSRGESEIENVSDGEREI